VKHWKQKSKLIFGKKTSLHVKCDVFCRFENQTVLSLKRCFLFTWFFYARVLSALFAQSWMEGFENVDSLFNAGWVQQNNSEPTGPGKWRKDNGNFTAQNGSNLSSIICDYTSVDGTGVGNISNWLFTPVQTFESGDTLFFWTRSYANLYYPDRLEVRISSNGASTDVGTDQFSVGVYSDLLLSINPNLDTSLAYGYPLTWKQYAVAIPSSYNGLTGRIAFRYFVTNGGANGSNGSTIGIDNIRYKWVGDVVGVEECPKIWWQLYPNPSSGYVTLTVDQPYLYILFSPDGKTVDVGNLEAGQNLLNLSKLNPGIYLMEIVFPATGKTLVRKILVY